MEGDNRTNEYHIHRAINYLLQINNTVILTVVMDLLLGASVNCVKNDNIIYKLYSISHRQHLVCYQLSNWLKELMQTAKCILRLFSLYYVVDQCKANKLEYGELLQ